MSQQTRQVTIIANHKNENKRFETDAQTFGELREHEEARGLFGGNTRAIVREGRNELSLDDAQLPSGSFTIIVVADKVKSGSDEYDEMGYHELRDECRRRGFDSSKYNGEGVTKNVMRAHLRDDDVEQEEEQVDEDAEALFEEMKERIDEVVEDSRDEIREILQEYTGKLPVSVIPDYSEDVEDIKRELGL